jgi:hypothetical protein
MKKSTRNEIKALDDLRLPELWARFAEVTGKETKAPNRKFLVRTIIEALEARDAAEAEAVAPPPAPETAPADETKAAAGGDEVKLTKLSVEELQAKYREVLGRDTDSVAKPYLVWKIRQAQKGRIPVGPRRTRRADGEAGDFKVLPLRMEANLVTQLDEARERLGLRNRMELFRRSLHAFLLEAGEVRVAELFAPTAE